MRFLVENRVSMLAMKPRIERAEHRRDAADEDFRQGSQAASERCARSSQNLRQCFEKAQRAFDDAFASSNKVVVFLMTLELATRPSADFSRHVSCSVRHVISGS
jgi:hypothetical protein